MLNYKYYVRLFFKEVIVHRLLPNGSSLCLLTALLECCLGWFVPLIAAVEAQAAEAGARPKTGLRSGSSRVSSLFGCDLLLDLLIPHNQGGVRNKNPFSYLDKFMCTRVPGKFALSHVTPCVACAVIGIITKYVFYT